MPCRPIVGESGQVVGFVCGPGSYRHLVEVSCPWCCLGTERTVCAVRTVFGGWCGFDFVCGSCGFAGSSEMDREPRISEERRDQNIEMVRGMQSAGIPLAWPELDLLDPGIQEDPPDL